MNNQSKKDQQAEINQKLAEFLAKGNNIKQCKYVEPRKKRYSSPQELEQKRLAREERETINTEIIAGDLPKSLQIMFGLQNK